MANPYEDLAGTTGENPYADLADTAEPDFTTRLERRLRSMEPVKSATAPFMAGALGETVKSVGAATELLAPETGRKIQRIGRAIKEPYEREAPVRTTAGEIASYIAPTAAVQKGATALRQLVGMGQPLGLGGRAAEAATVAGTTAALTTPGGAAERGTAAAIAAPLGATGEVIATKLGQSLQNLGNISETRRNLAKIAQEEGIRLTPGELTGNPMLKAADKLFSYLPITAGQVKAINTANERQVAETLLKSMGQQGNEINQASIGLAKKGLQKRYNDVLQDTEMNLDMGQFIQELDRIGLRTAVAQELKTSRVRGLVEALQGRAGQKLSGIEYNELRSTLGDIASRVSDDQVARSIYNLQRSVDEAAERSIQRLTGTPQEIAASRQEIIDNLKALRKQYTVFQDIFDAMRHKGMTAEGGLSLDKLYQAVNRRRPERLLMDVEGRQMLPTERLARLQTVKGEPMQAATLARSIPLAVGAGGLGFGLYTGSLPATLAALGGVRGTQAALYSEPVRRLLTEGLTPEQIIRGVTPVRTFGQPAAVATGEAVGKPQGR